MYLYTFKRAKLDFILIYSGISEKKSNSFDEIFLKEGILGRIIDVA